MFLFQSLVSVLVAAEMTLGHADIWWVFFGSGSGSKWLFEEVQRRNLTQVMLPGRCAPEEMPLILQQASALLVSLVRSPIMGQTVPSKVQAYLAAGRPILAALDGEGARIVTEAGAGMACAAQDATALSKTVLQLKSLPRAQLEELGAAGRTYYSRHFDPEVLTRRLLDCLRTMIVERSPRASIG